MAALPVLLLLLLDGEVFEGVVDHVDHLSVLDHGL